MCPTPLKYTRYASPLGMMTLACEATGGLVGAWFEGQRFYGGGLPLGAAVCESTAALQMAAAWLDAYFAKRPTAELSLPPLAPIGTPFRLAVWKLLLQIPYGKTTTYGDLARRLREQGLAASAQAVGGAVAHNPISIIIPCHRVWGANGQAVGYAPGIHRKWQLRRHEAACLV